MNYAVITLNPFAVVKEFDHAPEPLVWPNGDATHGVSPGLDYLQWRFVAATNVAPPNEFYTPTDPRSITFDGTTLLVTQTFAPRDLGIVKSMLSTRIDDAAEAVRQNTITSGSGQAMVYLQKQIEAQLCIKDQSPDPVNYPLLSATVGIEGATVTDVANLVAGLAAAWTTKAAQIERVRLTAKAAITAVNSVDEAVAAYAAVSWP